MSTRIMMTVATVLAFAGLVAVLGLGQTQAVLDLAGYTWAD